MKNSDALRRLIAELTQDFDFIVLNGEKNAGMSERVALGTARDEYAYSAKVDFANQAARNLPTDFEPYHREFIQFLWKLVHDLDGNTEPCA